MKSSNTFLRRGPRGVSRPESGRQWMPAIDPRIEGDDSRVWRRIEECPFDGSTPNPWIRRIRLN